MPHSTVCGWGKERISKSNSSYTGNIEKLRECRREKWVLSLTRGGKKSLRYCGVKLFTILKYKVSLWIARLVFSYSHPSSHIRRFLLVPFITPVTIFPASYWTESRRSLSVSEQPFHITSAYSIKGLTRVLYSALKVSLPTWYLMPFKTFRRLLAFS